MKKLIFCIAFIAFALQGFSQQADKGKAVFARTCIVCHQATGLGIPGAFPPLAKSDYLNKDLNRAIKQVIKGSNGIIVVNGVKFSGAMPAQPLSDKEIADVLTYVYSSWGNNKSIVTQAMVKAQRK